MNLPPVHRPFSYSMEIRRPVNGTLSASGTFPRASIPSGTEINGSRLTLRFPPDAAAPCWPRGRPGHVKVDDENGGLYLHSSVKHKLGNNLHTARMHARHAADTWRCVFPKGVRPGYGTVLPSRSHAAGVLGCHREPILRLPSALAESTLGASGTGSAAAADGGRPGGGSCMSVGGCNGCIGGCGG
jgi:hypothetical protein